MPALGTHAVELQLDWWEHIWEEDNNLDIPLMRLAAVWLRENMPPISKISLIHGDYRAGNFLFIEHDQKISSWLDWELGHLDDFHEGLGYTILEFLRTKLEEIE